MFVTKKMQQNLLEELVTRQQSHEGIFRLNRHDQLSLKYLMQQFEILKSHEYWFAVQFKSKIILNSYLVGYLLVD